MAFRISVLYCLYDIATRLNVDSKVLERLVVFERVYKQMVVLYFPIINEHFAC